MWGCVNYSRRFYTEVLADPATASPLVFPETVFNAPSSHLAAFLGSTSLNYTMVGDHGTFLQGLALGAGWLMDGKVDGCLVLGAEEVDSLTAHAVRLFGKDLIMSEGAGGLYLEMRPSADDIPELSAVTDAFLFTNRVSKLTSARAARAQLSDVSPDSLLCDGLVGVQAVDHAEASAWGDWSGPRISPKRILGDGFVATAAWQCAAAADSLARGRCHCADVSVAGCNEQVIAARFTRQSSGHG